MEFVSIRSIQRDGRGSACWKGASLVLHVVVLGALALEVRSASKVVTRPRIKARILVPYTPGHAAVVQPPRPKVVRPIEKPKLALPQPVPPPPNSGGDPNGEADVELAMANFYPDPKPDLGLLPHGTRGDVVVEVVIDEDGKVVETELDQGLGHGVDEAVMAVLETWTFYPATKAGKPVASKQRLLFHFERA